MNQNSQIWNIYLQLTGKTFSDAVLAFENLEDVRGTIPGDNYFGTFGPGNTIQIASQPYERLICYEFLLSLLKKKDEKKFNLLHKGTPFYFLAWLGFDVGDYEKGMFYLDRALSEDKNNIGNWRNTPGTHAILLELNIGVGPMDRAVAKLWEEIRESFRYYKELTDDELPEDIVQRYALRLVSTDNLTDRTLIGAFYGFIMKHRTCIDLIAVRGESEGNIEPFLSNLFKGGLIYESLLKHFYENGGSLDQIVNGNGFKQNFGFDKDKNKFDLKEFDSISNVISHSKKNNLLKTSIEVTGKLRNTTGHKLIWEDSFKDSKDFEKLYSRILHAIYSLLKKKLY